MDIRKEFWKRFEFAISQILENIDPDRNGIVEDPVTVKWEWCNPDGREENEQFVFSGFFPAVFNYPHDSHDRWDWANLS